MEEAGGGATLTKQETVSRGILRRGGGRGDPNKNKKQLAGGKERGQGRPLKKQEAVSRGMRSGGRGRPLTQTRSSTQGFRERGQGHPNKNKNQ